MKNPKKPKSVAATSRQYAEAFPKHPRQDAFLAAAVALRAEEIAGAANPTVAEEQAIAMARTEFDAGLHAMFFPPTERRFYFLWASAPEARLLIPYTQTAWANANGEYGERRPMHYDAKSSTTEQ